MKRRTKFVVVLRALVDTRYTRYLMRAVEADSICGIAIRRGEWTLTQDRDEAHHFRSLKFALAVLGSSKIARWAFDDGGFERTAVLVVGRPTAEWHECWPNANPIEMIGALA